MQRIKSVRWPARNIGGDRAYCKLRYVKGARFTIPLANTSLPKIRPLPLALAVPLSLLLHVEYSHG